MPVGQMVFDQKTFNLPAPNVTKRFAAVIYVINKLVFLAGKPFQPGLMFVGKAQSLPIRGASERCFTRVGSSPRKQ